MASASSSAALADGDSTAGDSTGDAAPITLLYVRPAELELAQLDARLTKIAERYAPLVEMRIVQQADLSEYNLPERYARFSGATPAVLVLRHGEVVGEAIGAFLPIRELDSVVRCAVEWS